jgi:hypothetical protein
MGKPIRPRRKRVVVVDADNPIALAKLLEAEQAAPEQVRRHF